MERKTQIRHPRHFYTPGCFYFWTMFIFILAVASIVSVAAAPPDKTINTPRETGTKKALVLHSYHNMDWTRAIQEGIESVFDTSGVAVEMHVEHMDTIRHPPKVSFPYLEELYRKKYGHISFDVILLSDNNALEFILSRRNKLFPGVPIVFCGINDFREEQLQGQSGITGVNEDIDIQGTIELASLIMPNVRKFLAVSDRTLTGLAIRKKFEQTLSGFSHKEHAFELLDDITAADLQRHLSGLSGDSAVLLFSFQQDKDGKSFTRPQYYRLISESSSVPVFTFWEQESLRHGIMGGVMVSGETHGKRAAEYALRILKGEPVSSLPFIMKSPNVPILNYPVLRKFNIPMENIPHEVVIQNQPITLYSRYRTTIWLVLVFFICMAFANIILLVNIARRKRAEQDLIASRLQLSDAMELARIVYWKVDLATGEFVFNDPFYAFYGTTAEREGGYRMAREEYGKRFFHPDDTWIFAEAARKRIISEEREFLHNAEHRIIRRDGEVRHVLTRIHVSKDAEGRPVRYYGANQDITERKYAEEKYRDIFENTVEGIYQSTPEGTYLSVNPALARIYGYESPQDLLAHITDIGTQIYVNPEDRRKFNEILGKQGIIEKYETERRRKDGTKIWVSSNARVARNAAGEILYYQGSIEDITERKLAEKEKAQLQSQLLQSQKMEAIGTLAGGVAHDFNNILTVITGYATLLQTQIEKGSPFLMYVDQIMSASQKAANLTRGLLAFSRKQPITLMPVKLNDIIKDTEKLLKRLLTEDIVLKTNFTQDDTSIMGDATQIDQILFNLATNARDALPRGGTIIIETRLVEMENQSIQGHEFIKPGSYCMLSFSDTGTGMDKSTQEHIFEPFFTTKEISKGTGLGLSTVYGIVKQHSGYITIYSEPGQGTVFHIYFPVIKTIAEEEKPFQSHIPGGQETILLAEDNDGVRRLMKTLLTQYGYTVIEAEDGADAVDKFVGNTGIGLIIIDSVMPKKNGREVYDEIRKLNPSIKALFTSGYTKDIVLDKGIKDGEFAFISKPISPKDLLRKVREVLDG